MTEQTLRPPRRTSRVAARALAWVMSATTMTASLPGCDRAQHDAPAGALASDDDGPVRSAAAPRRDHEAPSLDDLVLTDLEPPPPLVDPSLFGIDPDPAHWRLPESTYRVPADAVAALDGRVQQLEIELTVRPSVIPGRYVDFTLGVTALDDEDDALAWAELDSTDPSRIEGDATRGMVDAMLSDAGDHVRACSNDLTSTPDAQQQATDDLADAADGQAGGGGPGAAWAGGAMWWARQLCPQQQQNFMVANVVAMFVLAMLEAEYDAGIPLCQAIQVPAQSQACSTAAGNAAFAIAFTAMPSTQAAAQLATLSTVLADQVRNMGAAAGLGRPAPNAWPIFAPATALTMLSVGQASLAMASRATTAVITSAAIVHPFTQLWPARDFALTTVHMRMLQHREQLHFLILCLQNVVRWIAVAGLIGFVVVLVAAAADEDDSGRETLASRQQTVHRLDPQLVMQPDVQGVGPVVLDGTYTVLSGPSLPMANQHAAAAPLVFDITMFPSYLADATYAMFDGRTSRSLLFGYADPQRTLDADVWGLDELTSLPVLLAAAGTPVAVEVGYVPPSGVPELVVEGGVVRARGVWFDLAGQEIDAQGNPIALPWVCASLSNLCTMSIDTTGSPAQIAAGERTTRRWKIMATSSIVDLETGVPFEQAAGYVVTMSGMRERPTDPCYDAFDDVAQKWIRNHMLPGCGPVGPGGGGPGGGGPGGGGPGGGPGLPD